MTGAEPHTPKRRSGKRNISDPIAFELPVNPAAGAEDLRRGEAPLERAVGPAFRARAVRRHIRIGYNRRVNA